MFCTNCGEQMRDTDKFCAACGTKAAPPTRRRAEIQDTAVEPPAAVVPQAVEPPVVRRAEPEVVAAPAPVAPPPVSSTADFTARPAPAREHRAPAPQQMSMAAAAKMQEAKAAAEEQQRALIEAEEMAAVRDLVPLEMLPDEFPAVKQTTAAPAVEPQRGPAVPCPNCGRLNPEGREYCETCGREMRPQEHATTSVDVSPSWLHDQQPAKRSEPVRPPEPQVGIIPPVSVADPVPTVPDTFSYVYDDNVATHGNRTLLYVLVGVLALGVLGVLYLVLRPSSKPAHPAGNVAIRISPQEANVAAGAAYDFAATVTGTGNSDVAWSVQEGNAGGKLVERGAQAHGGEVASMAVYVAPPTPGTYHVVASSKADPTKSATADVIVSGK